VLACAYAQPQRVTAAGVLSGCGPLVTRASRRGSAQLDRTMLALSARFPFLARLALEPAVFFSKHAPGLAVKSLQRDLSTRDLQVFLRVNPDPRAAMEFFLEAFRSGSRGVVDDYRVLAAPWGFEPEEITVPVHFWHGDSDPVVPHRGPQAVAARIPHASFTLVPGEGHMLLMDHMADVFAALAPEAV
jgi:pimeloyl-ACP methyl ester carboxylesterase